MLVLGLMLVLFVVAAPDGILGLYRRARARLVRKEPAMSEALLEVDGVTKRFGGFTALDAVSVAIRPGERFGLVGPNGSGKTTLINCISGVLSLDAGRISFLGRTSRRLPTYVRTRRGIARSFQIPRPFKSMTVVENLMVALDFAVVGHGLGAASRHTK